MKKSERRRPHGVKNRRNILYGPLMFLLICAALVLGMSVFFKVSKITVEGSSMYTPEEIIEASGIEEGDYLFFVNRFTAASRIHAKLPYVDDVRVARMLPSYVTITITESSAMAYISTGTTYWVIDQNCRLLTTAAENELSGLIRIEGVTPLAPEVGAIVAAGEADAAKVTYLAEILDQMLTRDIAGDVTMIDMSDVTSPAFTYQDRFTVRLGRDENVEYKFSMLQSAVEQLTEQDAGTIDLSIDKRAHFSPG